MKKIQKLIMLTIWVFSFLIIGASTLIGSSKSQVIAEAIIMLSVSMLNTMFYLSKRISDTVKGYMTVTLTGLGCLSVSVLLGGVTGCYLLAFTVLGMAGLYFDEKVILSYTITFVGASIVVYLVNPTFITGHQFSSSIGIALIALYCIGGLNQYVMTKRATLHIEQAKITEAETNKQKAFIETQNVQVQENTDQLYQSILDSNKQLSFLSEESSNMIVLTQEMTRIVEDTVTSISECNTSIVDSQVEVEKNYTHATELNNNSHLVRENVTAASLNTEKTKQAVQNVSLIMTEANNSTQTLLQETEKIASILANIQTLANQTNLLSLNASIEASRAGEHGRGFAVVAEEVRSLSTQSQEASANIRNSLETLSNTINEVGVKVTNSFTSVTEAMSNLEVLANCLTDIDKNSIQSQNAITEEFSLISSLHNEFSGMVTTMASIVSISEENSQLLDGVTASIVTQDSAIHSITDHLNEVENQTAELVTMLQ